MSSNLSFSLFLPIVFLVVAWGGLEVAGRVVRGRGNRDLADSLQGLSFAAILLAAAYVVVMAVVAAVSYPTRISDMALIALIVFVFFSLLVGLLFVLSEVRVGGRRLGAYVVPVLLVVLVLLVLVL